MCPAVAPSLIDDRYRCTSLIATGGMGEVWRGTDEVLGRDVAIKVLRSEYADSEEFRERFRAEARAVASCSDPAVVGIYDYGEQSDENGSLAFLVMEYVDGESVATRLGSQSVMTPTAVADLLANAAVALDAAHRCGVVHRDVKPANLLLPVGGGVKVVDFGIASAADAVSLTRTGTVLGTAMYMSPEQAGGQRATPASDLYSLGAVAYAALAGQPPFQREAEVAVAMAHISDTPDPLPATVPAELAALVMALLAKDPADRPTAPDLAQQAAAIGEQLRAATAEMPHPTLVLPTPVVAAAPPEPVAAVEPDRRRWIVAGVVAAIVMFVGFAVGLSNGLTVPKSAAHSGATHHNAATHHKAATKPTPTGVTVKQARYLGLTVGPVVAALHKLGMNPTVVNTQSSLPAGTVIAVSPDGVLPLGTQVNVVVAAPAKPKPAPKPKVPPGQAKKDHGPGPGDGNSQGD